MELKMNLNKVVYQSFVITKVVVENKKMVDVYLSTTGKWIKSKQHAACMNLEAVKKVAAENAALYCAAPKFKN
jgi:hypothetical protein